MSDNVLAGIVAAPPPLTIEEVILRMEQIDDVLPINDGLKWFNVLYLLVTRAVKARSPTGGWEDAEWLNRLDVVFANLYFGAVADWLRDRRSAPRAWRALFEARHRARVMRVQFAACGMNAHINHDLPFAVVQTCEELNVAPNRNSPQHRDFQYVNGILAEAEPEAMRHLATGIVGVIDEGLGRVDNLLAMWSVRRARDASWRNAEILWRVRGIPFVRDNFAMTLDQMTGYAGRGLLMPLA